jgi:hypothetical protein
MSCEHVQSAIGAYALGALDPDEAAAVRRHLETCPECAAEHDALAPLPGLLSLDAFARDRAASPRRRLRWRLPRRRWLAAGAVGLAAVAAALVGLALTGGEEPSRRYDVSFRNVGAPPNASAGARIESSEEGTRLRLSVNGLPPDKEAVYEVLCDAEAWTATAGTFRTDAKGHAYVILTTALRQGEYNAIRIVRRGHRADGRPVKRNILTAKLS